MTPFTVAFFASLAVAASLITPSASPGAGDDQTHRTTSVQYSTDDGQTWNNVSGSSYADGNIVLAHFDNNQTNAYFGVIDEGTDTIWRVIDSDVTDYDAGFFNDHYGNGTPYRLSWDAQGGFSSIASIPDR